MSDSVNSNQNGNLVIPVSPISRPLSTRTEPVHHEGIVADKPYIGFKDCFIQDFASVRSRLSKSHKSLSVLLDLCKLTVAAERSCANLIDRSDPTIEPGEMLDPSESSAGSCIDMFRVSILRRGQQAHQFIQNVEHEVLTPLKHSLTDSEARFAELEERGLELVSFLKSEHKMHDEALIRFDKSQRKACEIITDFRMDISPETRVELGKSCYEFMAAECKYHEAVLRVNQARKEYMTSMEKILSQLEELERSRITLIKDTIDKMFIYGFALSRGIQYDLESSFKEIETISASFEKEVDEFISKSTTTQLPPIRKGPVKIVSTKDLAQVPVVLSPKSGISEEVQSAEKKIIDAIWTTPVDIRPDELEAIGEIFSTQPGRLSFCKAISGQQSELPDNVSLVNLGKVLSLLLTKAEGEMDAESGRRVASFGLKFFALSNGKKKYIQSEVYHHSLWNRIQFWEEALSLTIADSFINQYLERIERDSLFAFSSGLTVDRFGTFLMVFGISVQSAIDIVNRVIDRSDIDDRSKASLRERLLNSVKSAHERQERNVAMLQTPLVSP